MGRHFNRKRLFTEITCPDCGKTRTIWASNIKYPRCLSCSATRKNLARYADRPKGYALTCIDCGKTRTVKKIASLARRPVRCFSCARKESSNRPDVRARASARFSGAGSNFWQGGKTQENKRLRMTAEFREWRRQVFTRDAYTCQECGLIGGTLHPHHIQPFAKFPALRFVVDNGRTLCEPCHRNTDTFGARANRASKGT